MTAPDYSVMDITDHPPGDRRAARFPPENQDRCAANTARYVFKVRSFVA
jgi:hypothetical protein